MRRAGRSRQYLLCFLAVAGIGFGDRAFAIEAARGAAEDGSPGVENLLVTGTRLSGSLESIPSFVTVIDAEQIQARQPESVFDLFRTVPGVHVSQMGDRGGVSSVSIRGAEANFTIVLIDGVRVNDPTNSRGGSFDFATLNVADIERIEIVRGAQSSVYGSDGLSGVINIITHRRSRMLRFSADAEAGEQGFQRGSVRVGGPLTPNSQFSIGASHVEQGDQVPGSEFANNTLTARIGAEVGAKLSLDFAARYSDTQAESFPEDSGGPVYAVLDEVDTRDQEQVSVTGSGVYDLTQRVSWTFNAGYVEHEEEFVSPGVVPGVRDGVPPNGADSTLRRSNVSTFLNFQLSESIEMSAGMDYVNEKGTSKGFVEFFPGFVLPTDFTLERDTVGLFAEASLTSVTGFALTASLRHDDPDESESSTTGRIGAQFQSRATRIFASWGEGYKLPSFFALGHPLVGNADLREEVSTNWEVGIAQTFFKSKLELTLTGFRNEFEDLIDFDIETFQTVNRDRVNTTGFEMSASYTAMVNVAVAGHLSYTDIEVKDSTTTLRQRPDWRGGVNVHWTPLEHVELRLDWLYVGESFDSSIPTGDMTLDGYHRVDASVSWLPTDRLRFWLALDNAFDQDYQQAIGFPSAGMRGRLGVRFTL